MQVFCTNGTTEVIVNVLGKNFTCSSEGETVCVCLFYRAQHRVLYVCSSNFNLVCVCLLCVSTTC